jgi:hypothetical protein
VSEKVPGSGVEPDAADLGLTWEEWMDLQFAYNSGLMEPAEGTVADAAFRRMDAEVHRDYPRRGERDRADARHAVWVHAHPEEAAKRQAEAEAQWAGTDPATWRDIEGSSADIARAEAGLEPEAEP